MPGHWETGPMDGFSQDQANKEVPFFQLLPCPASLLCSWGPSKTLTYFFVAPVSKCFLKMLTVKSLWGFPGTPVNIIINFFMCLSGCVAGGGKHKPQNTHGGQGTTFRRLFSLSTTWSWGLNSAVSPASKYDYPLTYLAQPHYCLFLRQAHYTAQGNFKPLSPASPVAMIQASITRYPLNGDKAGSVWQA